LQSRPGDFGDDIRERLQNGLRLTSSDYALARRTQSLLSRQFEQFFDQYDVLLMPATPVTAQLIEGPDALDQARLLTRYTAPFNLTGLPAISLPCGFSSDGLPIGLQIVSRPWAEAPLLRAAFAFEQATEWHRKLPQWLKN
jgi:aspartyl-tRNA(Asn)/glutamyl-tRNA(Gln) amidotransferase subunit A